MNIQNNNKKIFFVIFNLSTRTKTKNISSFRNKRKDKNIKINKMSSQNTKKDAAPASTSKPASKK